jgi:hypothetical protein
VFMEYPGDYSRSRVEVTHHPHPARDRDGLRVLGPPLPRDPARAPSVGDILSIAIDRDLGRNAMGYVLCPEGIYRILGPEVDGAQSCCSTTRKDVRKPALRTSSTTHGKGQGRPPDIAIPRRATSSRWRTAFTAPPPTMWIRPIGSSARQRRAASTTTSGRTPPETFG